MASNRHIEIIRLACEVAEHVLPKFELVFVQDYRPRNAIEAGRRWSRGEISMTELRKAAFAAHAAARDAKKAGERFAEATARSAGHAAATAHVITHAPHGRNYALKASDDPNLEEIRQNLLQVEIR